MSPIFLDEDHASDRDLAVVIGNFDGVHRGHAAVVARARDGAARAGLDLAVLTFFPHPGEVLGKGSPAMLTTLERRAELLARLGVARLYVQPFDLAFAALSPEDFAKRLATRLRAREVVVGDSFRFGARRAGDLAQLALLGDKLGFRASACDLVSDDAGAISSTRVRVAVAQGDVREAERLLGRRHSIAGTVVHGDARGRTIGFPTANLGDVREMVPKPGVYAVVVDRVDGGARALARGVANVGMRPTVSAEALELRIEAHLFDFAEDLYDARIRVALVERLRDEKKFAGLSELRSQIEDDAARARAITAAVSPEGGRFT